MEEQNRKIGFVVSAEDDTKTAFQNIKTGAADMAASVAKSGEQAAKGVKGIGDGADEAAQKMGRAESAMAQALTRATEKAKIAAQAGESLSRAFEQKIEMRGLDATKLNPLVAKLREAEDALASFKAQQARDAGQSSFLESLRSQTLALGKTKSELLELQAAQLGVANQAAPYIAKLRETEASMGKVGVSAAQTAAAMRMVPAQFTDIVVSLQSGQAPLTVLLQQGGQLKDMFGGAGAAARGMAGYVVGLVNPFTVAAAAVGTLSLAYYQGSKESDAFRKALVLSGNQAGTTVDELNAMARAIASTSGTQGAAAAGLAEMARYSKVASDQLKDFTAIALQWEKTTGQAVSETAKQFADLAKDPLQASLALNEQMNYLTASIYDQIKALEKQGKTAEAAAVAQKAYADAMKTGADELTQNLGYIERAVQIVTGGAKKMWDAILGVGRQTSPTDQAAKHLETLQQKLNNKLAQGPLNGQTTESYNKGLEIIKKEIQQASDFLAFAGAAGKSIAETQAANKEYVGAMEDFDKVAGQFATKEVRRKQELTIAENKYNTAVEQTEKAYANSPKLMASKLAELEARYKNTVEGINKRYTEKGSGGVSISDNQLANLEGQLAAAKQYREQLLTLGVAAADLNAGERESLKLSAQIEKATNAKTRAKLQEAKVMADALGVQLRSNDGLEKSMKAHEAIIAGNYKSADSIAERAREQEAANAVFGKGRAEIERMTLATLENQMAEAQGSDRFDPKYIASLEAKIAAQKRYTAALQQADYKQMDDRLTKSLQTAKDELAIQKEGLSLLGADEVQRKKIIAQRRIELELSKELAAIERMASSGDADEDERQRAALRKKAREKAEMDTQTALLRIQEEYVTKQVEQYDEIFRKGFADMLNNGRDGWDSFTKSLTTTFKTTVADQIYKMFLRPFVVQVVASLVGVNGGNVLSSTLGLGGGSGGLLGALSNGSSIYSLLSGESFIGNLAKSAGSLLGLGGAASGLGLSAGIGSGLTLASTSAGLGLTGAAGAGLGLVGGGGLGITAGSAGAGAIGAGLGSGAAAAGVGSLSGALAAIPGWGWALAGGALLLGSMDFGSRGANHTGGAYSTSTGDRNAAASQALGSDAWGNALGDITQRANTALDAQLGKTVDALSGVYTSLAKYAGSSAKQIDIAAAFAVNPSYSDEDNYGYFRLIDKITGEALSTYKARDGVLGTDPEKAYATFVGEMGGALVEQLKAADIPGWMRSIFDGLGDEVTVDGLNQAIQAIAAVDAAFKGWADTLQGFSGLSAEVQTALLNVSGGIEGLGTNVNAFYGGFYSEAERMGILQRQVLEQLSSLDVTVDTSTAEAAKESFRATVEGALAAGNGELAAKLLALSGSFATAADYAAQSAEAISNAAKETAETAKEAAAAVAEFAANLRSSLIGLESQFAGGGFARQYQAEDLAGQVQGLFAGVGIQKDAGVLAGQILSATSGDVEEYFRSMWDLLDTDEARQKLVTVTGALLDLAGSAETAVNSVKQERGGLEQRWLQATGNTAELRRRELEALDPSNRALMQMIYGLEDAKTSMTDLTNAATTAAQKAAAAWQNWGTAAGLGATYLGDTSGLEARRAILGSQIAGSTDPADRLAKLQELISVEQAIGQVQQASRKTELEAIQARQSALQKEVASAQQLLSAAQSLGSYVQSLRLGEASGLSEADRLGALGSEYTSLIGKARGGDADALQRLQSVAGDYLGLSQTLAASGSDYSVLAGRVSAELEAVSKAQELVAQSQVTGYEAQIAQLAQQSELLSAQVDLSDGTKSLIAKSMIDQAEVWDRENTQALTLQELQQRAVDSLALMPAGIASAIKPTIEGSATYIANSVGGSVSSAINALAGMLGGPSVPAFAAGGLHAGGLRLVGERGPELEVTGPARYWSAGQTQALLGGGSTARLEALVERQTQYIAKLESRLAVIEANTGGLYDLTDQKSEGGNADRVELMNVESLASAIAEKMKETA